MLALYRSGRQADALSAYHDARRTLDEIGIEPGPELHALYGSILRQERSLVQAAPPALEDHYDEVMRAFVGGRLVPVLGPGAGGIAGGELARLLAERFELAGEDRGLAFISQAVAARNGVGTAARRAAPRARSRMPSRPRCTRGSLRCRRCSGAAGCRSS